MPDRKVVYVDFRQKKGAAVGGFGGGRGTTAGVFLGVLAAEILVAAAFVPSAIGSFFFGPTVIAVAVVATVWARRLVARVQVARLHRQRHGGSRAGQGDQGDRGRTLH